MLCRAAALCASCLRQLIPLLLEEDQGCLFPSRFPLPVLANNAARALLGLCSSEICPPTLLPGATVVGSGAKGIQGEARTHPHFAQLAPAEEEAGAGPLLGSAREGQPRELVRLGLARLCWLRDRGALRGEAQAAVLAQCGKVAVWAGYLDAAALGGPQVGTQ